MNKIISLLVVFSAIFFSCIDSNLPKQSAFLIIVFPEPNYLLHKEINLHAPAILPKNYCHNVNERLIIYKRLSDCENTEKLNELTEELIDRFGVLPDQAKNLIITHQLRVDIDKYDVIKVDASSSSIEITFQSDANIDPVKLIDLIQSNKAIKMNGPNKIKVMISIEKLKERSAYIKKLLKDTV